MTKNKIIDIDAEFDDVFFDEKSIMGTTNAYNRSNDPKWIEKITAINRARTQDPAYLARHRAKMQSDEYKEAHRATMQSDEYRAKKSQQTRDLWANTEYRALQKERLNTPETKAKQRAARLKLEKDPEFKKRQRAALDPTYKDPVRNATISKKRKEWFAAENTEEKEKRIKFQKLVAATKTKEDYKAIHVKRLSGDWHANTIKAGKKKMKPLLTPDHVFGSKKEAHLHYGFDPAMVDYNRKKKPNEWFFITVEDYEKCLIDPKHILKLRKLRLAGEYEEPNAKNK